jgi:UTP--glucose-1-phosphate uridylyltransferase
VSPKTTDDLLVLRSDVYEVGEDMDVRPANGDTAALPYVELDKRFYRLIDDFERRFPDGPPSLREATRLVVHGDVTFGANVRVHGAVELDVSEPTDIGSGSLLEPRS